MDLEPISTLQCQAMIRPAFSPFTFGKPGYRRCTNRPIYIGREKYPGEADGVRGEMSLCESCRDVAKKQLGEFVEIQGLWEL